MGRPGHGGDRAAGAPVAARRFGAWSAALVILLALAPGIGASPARAQTPSPLAEWQYSGGVTLERMYMGPRENWRVLLGVGASRQPVYEGADKTWILPGPAVEVRYKDLAFLSLGEGLGINVISGENYRAGLALVYDLGRHVEDDPAHLTGLANVKAAVLAKVFLAYAVSRDFPLVIRVNARRALNDDRGTLGDLSLYMPLPGSDEDLVMFLGPNVSLADDQAMRRLFGVRADEARASGKRPFMPGGGLKSYGAGFSLDWFVTPHWVWSLDLAVAHLHGDAARSPVTAERTGASAALAVAYHF